MAAGNNREITKAAQTLNELNFLENDGESLDGIHIIEEDRDFIGKNVILIKNEQCFGLKFIKLTSDD